MSFSFLIADAVDKEDAIAKLASEETVPNEVRQFVESAIASFPECANSTITIKCHGHYQDPSNGRGTSSLSLTIGTNFIPDQVSPTADIDETVPPAAA